MQLQQQSQQVNFAEMEQNIREIKLGLLETLKQRNPVAYLEYLGKIKSGDIQV